MSEKTSKFGGYFSWAVKRLALLLFDIVVVNLSYFLALVVRFYVNKSFRAIAVDKYLPAFWEFAPWNENSGIMPNFMRNSCNNLNSGNEIRLYH